jgi:hypothetical protein
MFEMLGLLFDICVFVAIGSILGVVYALLAWFLVRNIPSFKLFAVAGAGAIPILSSIWIVACVIVCAFAFPGKSYTLFGDIEEPLPNGYYLMALGKMPDFASIHYGSDLSIGAISLSKCVGGIAVDGPLVAGSYSHSFSEFTAVGNQGYFLFDSRSGAIREYTSLPQMETALGHPLHIIPTQDFHSREPFYLRDLVREQGLLFIPPVGAILAYSIFLLWLRSRGRNSSTRYPPF